MVSRYDWVVVAGFVASTATAYWYQVRYYKLVDDLIDALSPKDD